MTKNERERERNLTPTDRGMPYRLTGVYNEKLPFDEKNSLMILTEKTNRERRKAIIRELEARRRARIIDEADEWARRQ